MFSGRISLVVITWEGVSKPMLFLVESRVVMEKTGQWSDKSVIRTPESTVLKISFEKILSMREKVILLGLLAYL